MVPNMNPASLSEFLDLSVPDRIQLVETLWDIIAQQPDAVPLTDWQRKELDASLEDFHADPESGEPWEQVKADILTRR
jgi:putative addiction module component (TIGR02574 family)